MKNLAILFAFVCLFAIGAAAQSKKSDFSGEWMLDASKSKLGERSRIEGMTLKVTQTDKELKVETTTKRAAPPEGAPAGGGGGNRGGGMRGGFGGGDGTTVYSLEGKETTADGAMGGQTTLKAKVEKDNKLNLTRTQTIDSPNGQAAISIKETWELSADGKTLTVKRDVESPRGTNTTEMVFTRK
ncbi:MAG TPA: hypothetical protein VGB02_20300 [Pyrinomonadaceae bacterium]